ETSATSWPCRPCARPASGACSRPSRCSRASPRAASPGPMAANWPATSSCGAPGSGPRSAIWHRCACGVPTGSSPPRAPAPSASPGCTCSATATGPDPLRPPSSAPAGPRETWSPRSAGELGDELLHTGANLVTDRADRLDALTGRVVELPVLVPLARKDRAGIPTAHGDHHVGCLDGRRGEDLRLRGGDVDADLPHRLDGDRVDLFRRGRACRADLDSACGQVRQPAGGHL